MIEGVYSRQLKHPTKSWSNFEWGIEQCVDWIIKRDFERNREASKGKAQNNYCALFFR